MLCTPFATAVFGESKCVNVRTCLHNVSPDNKNALASRLREALTRRCPKAAGMMYDSPECAHYPLSLSTLSRNRCLRTHLLCVSATRPQNEQLPHWLMPATSVFTCCARCCPCLHRVSGSPERLTSLVPEHCCRAPHGIRGMRRRAQQKADLLASLPGCRPVNRDQCATPVPGPGCGQS